MSEVNFMNIENQMKSDAVRRYFISQRQFCFDMQFWNNLQGMSHQHFEDFPDIEEFSLKWHPNPSDNYLKDIFLDHFQREKLSYEESFQKLPACVLSCDHTFKVSVNIGFMNPKTKTWTKQYDSLFMILNEFGQVLSFEFVKTTAFSSIENHFRSLETSLGNAVKLIVLDNCCHWKSKIQKNFANADVKLDIFHAVQRITKKVSKKNEFWKEIQKNLRVVFRQSNDVKKERKLSTPNSEIILNSFDNFVRKWEKLKDSTDTPIFSSDALKACMNLRKHIEKGCLSDIPTGTGTNRNEKLHHFLNNSAMAIGRIGPELAKALLFILLYFWNSCRNPDNNLHVVYPVFTNFHSGNAKSICYFSTNKVLQPNPELNVQKKKKKKTASWN